MRDDCAAESARIRGGAPYRIEGSLADCSRQVPQRSSGIPPKAAALHATLDIDILTLPRRDVLAAQWLELESRSEGGFFVGWTWIGAWLESLPAGIVVRLLRAQRAGRVVGLALLVQGAVRTVPLIGGQGWWLHATGRPELDAIAVEHNGPLVDAAEPDVARAMLAFLCDHMGPCRRVTWPHLHSAEGLRPAERRQQASWRQLRATSWAVDLGLVREQAAGYLALLPAKTRYAIRRTRAACEAIGQIEVSVARSAEDAEAAMSALLRLHTQRWKDREGGSSFLLPFVRRFHERLLPEGMARGEVQLLCVKVGGRELGYLYSFVRGGRVSFYQSGIDYGMLGPKMSPGLLVIALAIEHNARSGHAVFDLLGGAGHYKKLLATHQETLDTLVIDRVNWQSALESQVRLKLVPTLLRLSGTAPDLYDWTLTWVRRIGLGLSLAALALAVDACSEDTESATERTTHRAARLVPAG